MKKRMRDFWSWTMSIVLVIGLMPTPAYAQDQDTSSSVASTPITSVQDAQTSSDGIGSSDSVVGTASSAAATAASDVEATAGSATDGSSVDGAAAGTSGAAATASDIDAATGAGSDASADASASSAVAQDTAASDASASQAAATSTTSEGAIVRTADHLDMVAADVDAGMTAELVQNADQAYTDALAQREAELEQRELETPTVAQTDAGTNGLMTTQDAASDTTGFASGTGTAEDPYLIETAAQLAYFSTSIDDGTTEYAGQYVALANDIDMTGITWLPIGTQSYPTSKQFKGTFDGRGHTVSNLSVTGSSYLGLFGRTYQATVKNVTVEGSISGLVDVAGGIVAFGYDTTIENCISRVDISGAGYGGIGGIAGTVSGDTHIVKCGNEGDVSSTHASVTVMNGVGGIVGWCKTSGDAAAVDRCYNTGDISTSDPSVGGIVGYGSTVQTVSNCTNSGTVTSAYTGTNPEGIGGIYGRTNAARITIQTCLSTGQVVGPTEGAPFTGAVVGCPMTASSIETNTAYTDLHTDNYALTGSYRAYGAKTSNASYDLEGHAVTKSAAELQAADVLTALGAAYEAGSDGYPILAWRNATLSHAVTFAVTHDNEANAAGSSAQVTVLDAAGQTCTPAEDGTYNLVNGFYSYTVEQRGYTGATGTFTVSGDDVTVPVELAAVSFDLAVTVSPEDATVTVTSGDTEIAMTSADEATGGTRTLHFAVYNGDYTITVSKFGYTSSTQAAVVSFGDVAKSVTLTEQEAFATSISVAAPDGVSFGDYDPRIDVYTYDAQTEARGTLVSSSVGTAQETLDLPAGEYVAVVNASGCASAQQRFTVWEAGSVRVELAAHGAWAGDTDTQWYEAGPVVIPATSSGSYAGSAVYLIYTPEQLAGLAELVDGGQNLSGATIVQAGDLDLSSVAWTRIGIYSSTVSERHAFAGTYDGDGHAVSNLSISSSTSNQGLFGYIEGGAVRNVTVGGTVTCTGSFAFGTAGIVGRASGATIENCTNLAPVTNNGTSTGGIVGKAEDTVVRGCENSANIEGGSQDVGGIVGGSTSGLTVIGCTNSGSVASTSTRSGYPVGGIVGRAGSGSFIESCANSGTVYGQRGTSTNTGAGGVAGSLTATSASSTIARCYNTGTVGGPIMVTGGIVGAVNSSSSNVYATVQSCYNLGTLEPEDFSGATTFVTGGIAGTAGSTTRMVDCYNAGTIGGDFIESGYTNLRAGVLGNAANVDLTDQTYFSHNYTVVSDSDATPFAFGVSGSAPEDVEGCGQTRAADEMKTSEFLALIGTDYALTSDQSSSYYNQGYPYLRWQDPQATFSVNFNITIADAVNDGGDATVVTLTDERGAQTRIEASAADGSEDVTSLQATCSLANGTYSYTVTKRGYDTVSGSVTVANTDVDLPVTLAATQYAFTVTALPADATVTLVRADDDQATAITAESTDAETGTTTFRVPNGSYKLTVRKFGYATYQGLVGVEYADGSSQVTLEALPSQTVTFQVGAADEGTGDAPTAFNDNGAVVQVVNRETGETVYDSYTDPTYAHKGQSTITTSLPQGIYRYVIKAAGYDKAEADFDLTADATLPVELTEHAVWEGAEDVDTGLFDASGDTCYIANAAELAGVAKLVNDGTDDFDGKTVVLLGDIDLGGQEWSSIGYYASSPITFDGTFDGGGYAVNGLYMTVGKGEGIGLFGCVDAAHIANTIVRGNISGSGTQNMIMYAGGIAGYARDTTFENCGSEINLDISNDYASSNVLDIGGICGWAVNDTFIGCYNSGSITGGSTHMVVVGGIAGLLNYTNGSLDLRDCYNTGAVTATGSASLVYAGGLVGMQGGDANYTNVYDTGLVTSTATGTSDTSPAKVGALAGALGSSESMQQVTNGHWMTGAASAAYGANGSGSLAQATEQTAETMASEAFAATMGSAFVKNSNEGGFPLLAWQDAAVAVEVVQMPRTAYNDREDFDDTGMQLQVTYASGQTKTVASGWVVHDGRCLAPTQTSVTVSFGGASVQVPITVTQVAHEITDSLTLDIAAPVVGEQPQQTIDTGSDQYDATIVWTSAGQAVTGSFAEATYYRAEVTLTSHYVDGDAWWVFADDAAPSVAGTYDQLYLQRSDDGRTITFTLTYPPTTSASEGIEPRAMHLYYEGDAHAGSFASCLDEGVEVTIEGETAFLSVADIEKTVLEQPVGQVHDTSWVEDGSVVTAQTVGVRLYELLQDAGLPTNAGDGTQVTLTCADGTSTTVTLADIRLAHGVYDAAGNQTATMTPELVFAVDGQPLRSGTSMLDGQDGPLMAVFGMDAADEGIAPMADVTAITIDHVAQSAQRTLTFSITDGTDPITDATVTLTDSAGHVIAGGGPSYTLNVGETYHYLVSGTGWTSAEGDVTVNADVTKDIVLARAWDGVTLTEPAVDSDGYYLIGTPEELMWWNRNGQPSDNVRLTADIAIGDTLHYDETTPQWDSNFGDKEANAYTGTFDGQGHTISGLYIYRENTIELWLFPDGEVGMLSDRLTAVGFFGYTSGATIKDVSVEGQIHVVDRSDSMYASYLQVGGIVGMALSNTQISGCSTNMAIIAEQATGGGSLGGYSYDGWPEACDTYVGGIAGSLGGGSSVRDCYSRGTLIGGGTRSVNIGGIVGGMRSINSRPVSVTDCWSSADINAYPLLVTTSFISNIGGIVGVGNVFASESSSTTEDTASAGTAATTAAGQGTEDAPDAATVGRDAAGSSVAAADGQDTVATSASGQDATSASSVAYVSVADDGTVTAATADGQAVALSQAEQESLASPMTEPSSDEGATITACFALNDTISSTAKLQSRTYAGRVAGSSGATVVDGYALKTMTVSYAMTDMTSAAWGTDVSAARARQEATYNGTTFAGVTWSSDTWQLDLDAFPILYYQSLERQTPDATVAYTPPETGDAGTTDGEFGEGAPPATFTVRVQVDGHDAYDWKAYTSVQMKEMAALDSEQPLRYSSYSAAGAAGRIVTEYVTLSSLLSDAQLSLESGDDLVMTSVAGSPSYTVDYDAVIAPTRYYFPHWDTYSPADAVEVEPVIALRSYGTSSGCSDTWLSMYAGSTDYLWSYVLYFGQTSWNEMTYGSFAYQRTGMTVRFDKTDAPEQAFRDIATDELAQASQVSDGVVVGETADQIEVGQKFVDAETASDLADAEAALNEQLNSADATNDSLMSAIEALEEARSAYEDAIQTGTKPIDFSGLEDALASARSDLAATAVSTDGSDVSTKASWTDAQTHDTFAAAIDEAAVYDGDAYLTQEQVDAVTAQLTAAQQAFDAAKQPGTLFVRESLANAEVAVDDQTYCGVALTPVVVVTLDGEVVPATQYDVFYVNNVQVGQATVYVRGKDAYQGVAKGTFAIQAADIAQADVSVDEMQAYTGEAVTPAVTVTLDSQTLVEGTDYTVAYADNVEVGTATVTVTGIGNYTGTATAGFTIGVRHNVIKGETEHGTVTLIDSADGTKATLYPYAGQTVTFRTSPEVGYTLTRMSYTYTDPDTGQTVTKALQRISGTGRAGTNAVYSFVMPDADVTLNAEFGENHRTIHKQIEGDGLLMIVDNADGTAATLYPQAGQTVRFKAIAGKGYKLTSLHYVVDGQTKPLALTKVEGTTNVYEFTMPNWDVTLTASYEKK